MTDAGPTNERDSLMKLTTDVQSSFQTLGHAFTRVCEEVHETNERVTKVETRLEKVEHRVEKVEHRLGNVESGLANQTRRISDLDRRMAHGFTELKDQIGRMDQRLAAFIEAQARMVNQSVRGSRRTVRRRR